MQSRQREANRFWPGDVVEVRPPAEILATLDAEGTLDAMPFMPEMLPLIGKRFSVAKRIEGICDTVGSGGLRRMRDAVFLDDVRCDGSAHGGCQAECRLYWKEAWLRRPGAVVRSADEASRTAAERLERLVGSNARRRDRCAEAGAIFRCQATEAPRATEPMRRTARPMQYLREISAGNVGPGRFLSVMALAIAWKIGAQLGLNVGARRRVTSEKTANPAERKTASLGLKPGEWVEVRSSEEIGRSLNARGHHRGLAFSPNEMLPACGKQFRVRGRIERIIDEKTGRMLTMKNDCITLEGLACTGERSTGRWFCARGVHPYWREAWLRRVDVAQPAVVHEVAACPSKVGLG